MIQNALMRKSVLMCTAACLLITVVVACSSGSRTVIMEHDDLMVSCELEGVEYFTDTTSYYTFVVGSIRVTNQGSLPRPFHLWDYRLVSDSVRSGTALHRVPYHVIAEVVTLQPGESKQTRVYWSIEGRVADTELQTFKVVRDTLGRREH